MPVAAGSVAVRSEPSGRGRGAHPEQARGVDGPPRRTPHPRWLTPVPAAAIRAGEGDIVAAFIEAHCRITKDSFAGPVGQPIHLRPWQRTRLGRLFARDPLTSQRLHRIALIGEPRKNGKTTEIAGVALYGLVMEEAGAEVYSVAGDKDQAKLVFGTARRMVEMDADLSGLCRLYRDVIEVQSSGSVYRAVSSETALKEGLNPSLTVVDEVHVIDEELWQVFRLAMGARPEPLMIGITTAGTKADSRGQPTIANRLYQHGVEVASGTARDPSFYFEWWGAPEHLDHRLPSTWRLANPGYRDILDPADLESAVRPPTRENDFRTKRLNQWTETITAWLPHGAWDGALDRARSIDPAEPFVAFLDGSWSNDSTGIVGCTIERPHLSVLGHWTPDPTVGHIDMAAVESRVREVLEMPGCRRVSFDPARFQDLFARLELEGWPVVEWPTNSLARMVPACQEFYAAVIERRLSHDGDERLALHVGNAVLKEDRHGPRIVKETKSSMRKIDLAVCAVGSYAEARAAANEPLNEPIAAWA